MRRFKIWGVKDLLEISHDAMKCVMIKDSLQEAPRMKWQDANMSN